VRHQVVPAAQARRLLARQLHQLPRWLQQTRYNGPPPLVSPRDSPATASNYSNNAALSWNGRQVVFESYEAKLAIAKSRGEIAVMARRAGDEARRPIDRIANVQLQPRDLTGRPVGRVRVGGGQPQLREALWRDAGAAARLEAQPDHRREPPARG
jgi:hypothetical protein